MELLNDMGISPKILSPLRAMYGNLRRYFRLGGGALGKEFEATNGILQGCAVSVVLLNALLGVWAHAVQAE
eukprot:9668694-Karenia_brevis.AAC.1